MSNGTRLTLCLPLIGLAVVAGLAVVTGCGKDPSGPAAQVFQPTGALLLSTGSPTKDEDPSVLRGRDGTMFVAWFSDRGGNADIYLTSTRDGTNWTSPTRVTSSGQGDFYPQLLQDDQGTLHLVWFRWDAPFRGHILYNRSADGLTWDQGAEEQVTTTSDVDDWVPTLTQATDGTLLVYFVSEKRDPSSSTTDLFVARKAPTQSAWEPAVRVTGLNSNTENDHLPYAARTGSEITLVWVRHDTTQALPWLAAKSHLFYSTSPTGMTWTSPTQITNDAGAVIHLFPALYPSHSGQWFLLWLSTRLGPPSVFDLPFAPFRGQYPQAAVELTALPGGYSHRVAPTPTQGVYLGVWVQGPDGAQDVYYRFFRK